MLSSTSNEVCELFDGTQIVRVLGEPDTKEFVYDERTNDMSPNVWGLKEALKDRKLTIEFTGVSQSTLHPFRKWFSKYKFRLLDYIRKDSKYEQRKQREMHKLNAREYKLGAREQKIFDSLSSSAPNIILNAPNAVASSKELWTFALVGIASQILVLIFGALTTYHWDFKKAGSPIASYAYPCTLTGTIAVSAGLLTCSHVIEGSTDECNLLAHADENTTGVLRIQRACSARFVTNPHFFQTYLLLSYRRTRILKQGAWFLIPIGALIADLISEQHFASFALFNSRKTSSGTYLRTSRLNDRKFTVMATIGCSISITGFIVQFIGLRALQ